MTRPRALAAVSALALLGAAGCGGTSTSQDTSAAADSAPSLTITAPHDGATVASSFPLRFTTSVPIGPLDTGKDHVHVVVDGNTDDFAVVTAHKTMVTHLSPGTHTIGVTLQHADHSSAGAENQVTVTVGKGGSMNGSGSGGASMDDSGTDSGTDSGSNSGGGTGNGYGRGY